MAVLLRDIIANGLCVVNVKRSESESESESKKSADLYFQVPKDDANLMLHYKASFWQDKTLNIKL